MHNELRHYAWGSKTAMAELFGRSPSGKPEAELWIGAHPDSPSLAELAGTPTALDELIAARPEALLGAPVANAYGRLPFLMKVLAAGAPLSLQVHPTLEQATSGFAAENAAGVTPDAPHRNYRDNNHKPEMLYALTDFTALCGFRPLADSARLLLQLAASVQEQGAAAELTELADILQSDAHENSLYTVFDRMLHSDKDCRGAYDAALGSLASNTETDPALATAASLSNAYPHDAGSVLSLLLNLVTLQRGEAIWLPAGNVHAYLLGLGIEVMSSSDNVLRGGLTKKYVDTSELMKTVNFTPLDVPRIHVTRAPTGEELLQPPCSEFQLQKITFPGGLTHVPLAQNGPVLVLVVSGTLTLSSSEKKLSLTQGESAFVAAYDAPVTLTPHHEPGSDTLLAFGVTIPHQEAGHP
nr:mannose-6-phosphate isomerase, class I [Arthrobacter roseus]